jgi:hypothetical protein
MWVSRFNTVSFDRTLSDTHAVRDLFVVQSISNHCHNLLLSRGQQAETKACVTIAYCLDDSCRHTALIDRLELP